MKNIGLALAIIGAASLAGCLGGLELEIPVATKVATVEGNEILHKAEARLHGEILEPARIDRLMGVDSESIESIRMMDFRVDTAPDALDGLEDIDDLEFVESMVLYVRSVKEDTTLPDIAVGWYYEEDNLSDDPFSIEFEVDQELELKPYIDEGFELYSKSVGGVPADDVAVQGFASFLAIPFK